jgi:hypothetical protein
MPFGVAGGQVTPLFESLEAAFHDVKAIEEYLRVLNGDPKPFV